MGAGTHDGAGHEGGNGAGGENPPLVGAGAGEVVDALEAGSIVAVPAVGGYSLVVRAGSPDAETRLAELAADTDGPHFAVGHTDDVRALTSGWTDELARLLERCWPGPVEVFLSAAGAAAIGPNGTGAETGVWAAVVGMPDGRPLRRLCREHGPWRTVPLRFTEAAEVARAFDAADVALVVDGGRRDGPPPTLVDATVSPIRVLREGALPASFIEGTMLMSTRRRLFSRQKPMPPG
jgi:L-threonylcarbamoyladenylate synthase